MLQSLPMENRIYRLVTLATIVLSVSGCRHLEQASMKTANVAIEQWRAHLVEAFSP